MRIFILDDQPGLAEMLAMSLCVAVHSANPLTNAIAALAAIMKTDLLVTDYHTPEMTGLEMARRAYAQGWRGSLLIMSGHVTAIDEPLDHPLLHLVLNKPFSAQELIKALPNAVRNVELPSA